MRTPTMSRFERKRKVGGQKLFCTSGVYVGIRTEASDTITNLHMVIVPASGNTYLHMRKCSDLQTVQEAL